MSDQRTTESHIRTNLCEVLKKIVLAFCEVNVDFSSRLDIYGSIHVRADDTDVTNFVLNEHTYRPQEVADYPCESLYERHTSDVKGSVSARISLCRSVCTTENKQENRQVATSEASAVKCSSVHQHKRDNSQPTVESPRLVVQVESSNDSVTELTEQDNCLSNIPPARNVGFTNTSTKQNGYVEGKIVESAVHNGCHSEGHSIMERSYAVKVEQSVDDFDTSYFEPDDGSHIVQDNRTSYGGSNNEIHRFNQSMADQYFAGNDQSSAENHLQASDWLQSYSGSDSASTVCSFCAQSFISVTELRRHIRQMHVNKSKVVRQRRQPCPVSASELKTDASLNEKYFCSLCALTFRSRDGLRCHENTKHSRNKLYHCQYCDQSFFTRQSSYLHRVKFHRVGVKKFC